MNDQLTNWLSIYAESEIKALRRINDEYTNYLVLYNAAVEGNDSEKVGLYQHCLNSLRASREHYAHQIGYVIVNIMESKQIGPFAAK